MLSRSVPALRRPPPATRSPECRGRRRRLRGELRERGERRFRQLRRLPGERQALDPQRDRQRRRVHLQAQQLRGHPQRGAVPQRPQPGLPRVPQAGVLRRERRPQPAQIPSDAEHRRQVRGAEESHPEMPNVRDGAREGRHGDVRAVRGTLLRLLQGVLPPQQGAPGQARPRRAQEVFRKRAQGQGGQVPRARGRDAQHVLSSV